MNVGGAFHYTTTLVGFYGPLMSVACGGIAIVRAGRDASGTTATAGFNDKFLGGS